jgi:hypothetical protein
MSQIHTYIHRLRARLLACHATNQQLVEAGGGAFSPSWVSKFRAGRMANPRYETLLALDDALTALAQRGTDANARAA